MGLTRDLAPISARVPTGRAPFAPASADPPSTGGARPFGLRFANQPTGAVGTFPDWRYDPAAQIAVIGDGTPLHLVGPTAMTMKTTGASSDGTGSTGGEEWNPDFAGGDGGAV